MSLPSGENVTSAEYSKTYETEVIYLTPSSSVTVDSRGWAQIAIITDSSGTATISRVDTGSASSHVTGSGLFTISPATLTATPIDWPYYYITVSGGNCRVAGV